MSKEAQSSRAVRHYLREVERTWAEGNATEHSYRPTFKVLVESLLDGVTATNEPRRVQCGAPDFIVSRGETPVGYMECKDVGLSLDEAERSAQLQRYLESLDNLILTNYLEFRYFVGGQARMHVLLGRMDANGKLRPMVGADGQLASLLEAFASDKGVTISTPKELAAKMANLAKVIREAIEKVFSLEGERGTLHGELESFRATILADITPQQFADMYAQTICYGMFSARANVPDQQADGFTREHAAYDLPATNPFLREVFEYIAGTKLDPSIVWAVDSLAGILRRCDMHEILRNFGTATRREDPVVHFYETFLAAYDPALRESRGVYYTPEPVVSYIVRSVDHILKEDFACPAGLADSSKVPVEFAEPKAKGGKVTRHVHRVEILDPAAGTGTFLYETVRRIYDATSASRGIWSGERGYVTQHLLPRLYGFELMMAPYAVAHLKLGWLLKETGYNFPGNERLRVYLTNTLEQAEVVAGPLLALADQIAREANAASQVKGECPIMVVMGNPPYSGHSANRNRWSRDLIREGLPLPNGAPGYFECDGEPLGEKNPKWLNDDYVKFIRFAQYRIERTGYGILAFITNHGYLDNPTFRGMRRSLMRTFDSIYVLDLHGNAKKRERGPDGSRDENVFDIMQGVAIGLFVRRCRRSARPIVRHSELYGPREGKYLWLWEHDVSCTKWRLLRPQAPSYLFVPRDGRLALEYERSWSISDALPVSSVGIVTGQDRKTIAFTTQEARGLAATLGVRGERVVPVLYRPFDVRFLVYDSSVVTRPRMEVMRHMLVGRNIGLLCTRQTRDEWGVLVTRHPAGHKSCSAYDINTLFPLYLYPDSYPELIASSPWPPGPDDRRPNVSRDFADDLAKKVGLTFVPDGAGDLRRTFGPEDILRYSYAVFHAPRFRSRYVEFLKAGFPRLPLTADRDVFGGFCSLGDAMINLHLLKAVPAPRATYPHPGANVVVHPHYKPPTSQAVGRIYVNDEQFLENVPPEVWAFQVGGYKVCQKWLKDREDRTLSYDDIEHYRAITEAIRQTIRLMSEIDAVIPAWPME